MRRRTFIAGLGSAFAASPITAQTQAKSMPVIGFLNNQSAGQWKHLLAGFHQGLGEAGFVEGQNVAIDYRWAEGKHERLTALAADLVARKVDAIVASGGLDSVRAAKASTSALPVVFIMGPDPVQTGIVQTLARPEGNLTGFTLFTFMLGPKRLELLRELVSGAAPIGVLVNPSNANAEPQLRDLGKAAASLGLKSHVERAGDMGEVQRAFAAFKATRVRAVFVASEAYYFAHRSDVTALAAQHAIPAIFETREFVEAGGLFSYGVNFADVYRQAGLYTARILRGAKPAALPVVQPCRFELVLNLKTAKALGLTFPPTLLALANEVLE